MNRPRNKTRSVTAGDLQIGGGAPISIQSMTNIPIEDVDSTVDQIRKLNNTGAELVRIAVRNEESIEYLKKIRKMILTPLSADVHFNYRIAIGAIEAGINKIRINPGNIGDDKKVREVVKAARDHSVPIRIGVNGGSVDRKKYKEVNPESLVESAMEHVKILEDNGFSDIVVSIKSSDIFDTIEANRIFAGRRDYPIHIGLTEAGYGLSCVVQSSMAIGHLLLLGIGDTIRVSMTGDPVEEVVVAKKILESAGERNPLIRIISCPTCGRTEPSINILDIAKSAEETLLRKFGPVLEESGRTITVAVMGCEVNGPGEAAHADIGVAGGRDGTMLLFAQGRKMMKVAIKDVADSLSAQVEKILEGYKNI
ncbi:MAG: flavodoxin-dependent (E)-4-hydroxy-3-methylbut-2-enyl-diphosphate synthase [Spirochaetes bacterium]|nr:flavodoxin-dependent (E)-4-hydroxy-3-methylbut-2-enyl-diphosphate synthase [Spirochaetota bacterium]